jgi:hypothetical protein
MPGLLWYNSLIHASPQDFNCYCADDYQELFSIKCHQCDDIIHGKTTPQLPTTCSFYSLIINTFPSPTTQSDIADNVWLVSICIAPEARVISHYMIAHTGEYVMVQSLDQKYHPGCLQVRMLSLSYMMSNY